MPSLDTEFSYKHTSLWQSAFASNIDARFVHGRDRLRVALDNLRERASLLSGEIALDLRDLTVHDLSHSDALWDVASVIAGPTHILNPLEAFVLGASFLVHDLGMGLAAYPEGLDSLHKDPLWDGMLRNFFKRQFGRSPDLTEIANPPPEVLRRTQFEILRILHARRAEHLLNTSWSDSSGTTFHLLEDVDLRLALGHLIGKIAYSHWLPTSQLPELFAIKPGAPVCLPGEWKIDSLKVALLLRTADAAHIDARRAPAFLRILRHPEATSDLHWSFQEKLFKVQLYGDRLLYTGMPFPSAEAGAWWLCVDTLKMIDSELRGADELLSNRQDVRFAAHGVVGIGDTDALEKLLPALGWMPVDARVHVSNIATLVSRLGGAELYGQNDCAALRELLQNAADAIEARRIIQGKPMWGRITVRLGRDEYGAWLEIEDDGVGMNQATLTGQFLDFGKSFWSATEAVIQFPQLAAVDFRSIGKFGVGFFSVFMWGDRVRVTSRRYEAALSDTCVLTFEEGLHSRPIFRTAELSERLTEGGTRIRVWLKGVDDADSAWMRLPSDQTYILMLNKTNPRDYVRWLCPMLGIEIYEESNKESRLLIGVTDWKTMRLNDFATWSIHPKYPRRAMPTIKHVRPIYDSKKQIIGRAAISPDISLAWILVGGMRSNSVGNFIGAFIGEPTSASRGKSWVNVHRIELSRWANEQAVLIAKNFSPEDQADCSRQIDEFGGKTNKLALARVSEKWLKYGEVEKWASSKDEIIILSCYQADRVISNVGGEGLADNVMFEPSSHGATNNFQRDASEMEHSDEFDVGFLAMWDERGYELIKMDQRFGRPVLKAIASAWGVSVKDLFLTREYEYNVGTIEPYIADDAEVIRRHTP